LERHGLSSRLLDADFLVIVECNLRRTNYWRHMPTIWSEERRVRQSEAIQRWRPWERSTGPRTVNGKARSARNADVGGQWQRFRQYVKILNAELQPGRC
jgi:hypothetical protein